MFVNYLPLHSALTGWHENIPPEQRPLYLVKFTLRFGGYVPLLAAAIGGLTRTVFLSRYERAQARSVSLLIGCTSLYTLYATLAGKFWDYHWMPFAYFCSMSAALCLYAWPRDQELWSGARILELAVLTALVLALVIQLRLPGFVRILKYEIATGPEIYSPLRGRVDEMTAFLDARLEPGDTVQPLDWTGGSIHAMLQARARLATRFMYDYHFYHHVSSHYIMGLRRTFIDELKMAPPRFVIDVQTEKPWVWGIDTTQSFPELNQFLTANYTLAFAGDGYYIYERRP